MTSTIPSFLCAEQNFTFLLPVTPKVGRLVQPTSVTAPLVLHIHHPNPQMLTAELALTAASNTVERILGANSVGTPLVDDIHHPAPLVVHPELPLAVAGNTVDRVQS